MPKNIEVVAEGFVNLARIQYPEKGINNYYYLQERVGIVAVLPYRRRLVTGVSYKTTVLEFLIRSELCPPWGTEENYWTCITGGTDDGTPDEAAIWETREEAGIEAPPERFHALGRAFGSKAVDARYWLYAVNVTGLPETPPQGDGSELERVAFNRWVVEQDVSAMSDDALVYALLGRAKTNPYFDLIIPRD